MVYTDMLYIGAVTKGFVINTIPLKISMNCGNEVLKLKTPNFIDLSFYMD